MAMDPAAVEALVREHGARVYGFCRQLARTRADADDVYQQAFLRIMDMPGTLDAGGNPAGFVMAVAARVWRDEVRKRSRRERIAPTVDADDPLTGCEPAAPDRVEDGLEADQARRDVRRAVRGAARQDARPGAAALRRRPFGGGRRPRAGHPGGNGQKPLEPGARAVEERVGGDGIWRMTV